MSTLLQLKNASLGFGIPPIIENAELLIKAGERVCLVGRNGCGKSTLLKVINNEQILDDGQRIVSKDVVIARLEQDPPQTVQTSIFDYVAEGLATVGQMLKDFFHQTHVVATDPSDSQLAKLEAIQQQLDIHDAWQYEQRITQVLTQLQLQADMQLSELSGGWRRKAALARALVLNPDILLLDEPTNHLDVNMIKWLEKAVLDYKGAVVFVSHDRAFIRNIATRIVDLDRGQLVSFPGDYQQYLLKKAELLQIEESHNAEFDKKLNQEETWIRQGIKARRTRNEGRVRALKALRQERAQRVNRQGKATVVLHDSKASGKLVFEGTNIHYSYEDKPIVDGLDISVMRGDKLALIGPNGCGKSTLLKILLGQIEAQQGEVRQGTNLELAYFDQHRQQLELDKKVVDVVADGKREITVNGHTRHVISYLQDYLFTPDRINAPVSSLSGGEKNRLLLAKLLAKPSNLLILDEPTNDLDVETLELLEDVLGQYQGTVILVSHDREFVDNLVTSSLFFEGEGRIKEFVGGYQDIESWYAQQQKFNKEFETSKPAVSQKPKASPGKTKKLSYKLKLELEQLPAQIEELEQQLEQLQQRVNDPEFFKQDASISQPALEQLTDLQQQLESAYLRWDELEALAE